MTSMGMTTSNWIRFFREAGIPASVAANYAVLFTDNRIQTGMLLDLNKEYLRDMGITVMGDIIAILKHSKRTHEMHQMERVLGADGDESSAVSTSQATLAPAPVTKKIPPAPAKLGENSRKSPKNTSLQQQAATTITTPSSSSTSTLRRTISSSLASRLGRTPNKPSVVVPAVKKVSVAPVVAKRKLVKAPEVIEISSENDGNASQKEEVPVVKKRRVLPEHEGRYKVIMPSGTVPKTQRILGSGTIRESLDLKKKTSVFERLGDGKVSSTTSEGGGSKGETVITITGLGTDIVKVPSGDKTAASYNVTTGPAGKVAIGHKVTSGSNLATGITKSVFQRLGGKTQVSSTTGLSRIQILQKHEEEEEEEFYEEDWEDDDEWEEVEEEEDEEEIQVNAEPQLPYKGILKKVRFQGVSKIAGETLHSDALVLTPKQSVQNRLGTKATALVSTSHMQKNPGPRVTSFSSSQKITGKSSQGILAAPQNAKKVSVKQRLGGAKVSSSLGGVIKRIDTKKTLIIRKKSLAGVK